MWLILLQFDTTKANAAYIHIAMHRVMVSNIFQCFSVKTWLKTLLHSVFFFYSTCSPFCTVHLSLTQDWKIYLRIVKQQISIYCLLKSDKILVVYVISLYRKTPCASHFSFHFNDFIFNFDFILSIFLSYWILGTLYP